MSTHSQESKREVIRLRATGMSFTKIAEATGVSRSAAHYIVQSDDKACLVAIEPTPAPNSGVPFPPSTLAPGLASQAIELRKSGLTNQAIATRLGVSITDVVPWTYGVPKAAIKKPDLEAATAAPPKPHDPTLDDFSIPEFLPRRAPVEMFPDAFEPVRTTRPAVDVIDKPAPAAPRPYGRIPSGHEVARFIDDRGIDAACERWIDIERDQLLAMWRTVKHLRDLDRAEAEAAALVEKPSLWVRFLRFIGLR